MSELFTENGALPAAPAELVAPAEPLAAEPTAAEVAPVEPAPTPEPAAAEPALDPRELLAELEYLRSTNEQLLTRFSQQQPQPGEQPPQGGFDPSQLVDEYGQFRPDKFAEFQMARDQALLQTITQQFQPIQQQFEQQAQAATQQRYGEFVDGLIQKNMDQAWPEGASAFLESRAAALMPGLNERFGTNPDGSWKTTVLELAVEKAATEVKQLLGGAAGTAEQRQAQRLAELAGLPGEPGNGAGGAVAGQPEFKSAREVVEYYAQGGAGFARNMNGQQ